MFVYEGEVREKEQERERESKNKLTYCECTTCWQEATDGMVIVSVRDVSRCSDNKERRPCPQTAQVLLQALRSARCRRKGL